MLKNKILSKTRLYKSCPMCAGDHFGLNLNEGTLMCVDCGYIVFDVKLEETLHGGNLFVLFEDGHGRIRQRSIISKVVCPKCSLDVSPNYTKKWKVVTKKRFWGPHLGVKIFEHCGRVFRVSRTILYHNIVKGRLHERSGTYHIFAEYDFSSQILERIVFLIRQNKIPSLKMINEKELKKLRSEYWFCHKSRSVGNRR